MTWYTRDVSTSESANRIVITRERPRGLSVLFQWLLGCACVCGWAVAEYQTARQIVLGLPNKSIPTARLDFETWVWFAVWSVVGIAIIAGLCVMILASPETITLTSDEIVVSSAIKRFLRRSKWQHSEIDNLRVERIGQKGRMYVIKMEASGKAFVLAPPSDRSSTERVLELIRANLGTAQKSLP